MKKIVLYVGCFLSLLLLTLLCSRCSREYSYEGTRLPDSISTVPPAIASYSLAGSPVDCTNPVIDGTYIAGIGLNNTHVQINLVVTSPGNYSITTDTVDGIHFSAAGSLGSAGNQTITLEGSGRPDLAGLFPFTLNAGTSHCSFYVSVRDREPLATYVLESGAGAGQATCICSVSGTYQSQVALTAANVISTSVYVASTGNFTVQTKRINGMSFSCSGTFTSTGSQYITLSGSGTPLSPGTFTFVPQIVGPHPLGGEACAVDISVK